jgi:diguanylate cyclase
MKKYNETQSSHRILVVDDNTAIHEDFRKILIKSTAPAADLEDMESMLFGSDSRTICPSLFEIDCAFQGKEGLEMVQKANAEGRPYALAFVDGRMPPGWDGIETISHLWKACPDLQVVLCTAYADYSWQEIRRVLGESDSLLILKKPFDNVEVLQLAHAMTRKWELNREILGRLNQLAFYDGLTSLPNRTLFIDRLSQSLDNARRYNHQVGILFIDLDNFKRINDTLGHSIGDDLLKIMAERLIKSLRVSDTISRPKLVEMAARLGGDEFTVILPKLDHEADAGIVAQRIGDHLSSPIELNDHQFIVTPSIGIAIYPHDGENVETLLKNADLAMYFAKNIGPCTFKYYQQSMNATALKRLTIENQLRKAAERNEFILYYQPQFDLITEELSGMEALLRWNNRELGNVPPIEFIPIAEENGLIIHIGEWVLRTACQQAGKWLEQELPLKRIAVNVSVKQFTHPAFLEMVRRVLSETGLNPSTLEIEITESLLAQDPREIASTLESLKRMDIRIAVDDFGTGYSSLSRLKDMPIDCLKIDRSFVCGIEGGTNDKSIISAIIAMAKSMDLRVIAEGVETHPQVNFLVGKDCQEAQGFLFSRPLPPPQAEAFLKESFLSKSILETVVQAPATEMDGVTDTN